MESPALPLSSPQLFLGIILLVLPILWSILIPKQKNKSAKYPPSPPKLPIIGNLHQLGAIPHYNLWKLSERLGPVMLLQLGRVPTIVVSSPEAARDVLKNEDLSCCSRPRSPGLKKISYDFLDVAFCPYGEYWREMRKFCLVELLSSKKVQSFWDVRESEIAYVLSNIAKDAPKPVEIIGAMFNFTNSVICRIAFGTSHRAGDQFEQYETIKEIIHDAMILLSGFSASDFFPSNIGGFLDTLTGLRWRLDKCHRNLDNFFEKVIDEHLDPERPKPELEDIVDIMLGLAKERSTVLHFTRQHIKAMLVDVFLGATDTSSTTITWAMAELIKNPRVMKKLQQEIRSCIGKKPQVSETELDKLKYLNMVVKETFRLHPPATLLIPRETINPCKIGGYDVDAKTRVLVNAWAVGRDPNVWENPQEFIPERFEGKNKNIDYKGQDYELIPFGSGRRICPGMNMGQLSVHLTLANLLHCFDWELPNGMKPKDLNMDENFTLVSRMRNPLYLVPVKHNWED